MVYHTSAADHDHIVKIQVKTKTSGTWQTSTQKGKRRHKPQVESKFWVFVDLGSEHPEFYVIPEWWIQNDIYKAHSTYLKQHDGHRASNDASTHHAVPLTRIQQWHNRWDQLGILPKSPR